MPQVAPEELLTVSEAAELLQVSARTVARMQADGDLEPVYLTRARRQKLKRYRRADVEALAERTAVAS